MRGSLGTMPMRALVKQRPERGLDLLEVPDPRPQEGEVLVRVEAAGVCGSDVARYVWTDNYRKGAAKSMEDDLPRILGHEFAGTVIGLGPGSMDVRVGDRVIVRNILECGHCWACQEGRVNICDQRRTIGVHVDGGYAELVAVPAANCSAIPERASFHLAAALQPFAVSTHAVRQAGLGPGDRIAVWGLGPIGLAVAFAARVRGVETVAAFDLNPERVAWARKAGVPAVDATDIEPTQCLHDSFGPRSIDAMFDAAGALSSMVPAVGALRKGGPVVLIGNLPGPLHADLMPMIMDEQRLIGSRGYTLAAWRQALQTISGSGFERTLGDEVGLAGAIDSFEASAAGTGRPFTIIPTIDR